MARYNIFKKALKKVAANKKTAAEKAKDTKAHIARLCAMQEYVDMSAEKRKLLVDTLKTSKCTDCDKTLLEKGVIVYVQLLKVVDAISADFDREGIEYKVITSKTTQKARAAISDWFMKDPYNHVVLLSQAGGESINLNSTNEIVLYNIPNGSGKFNQTIGRICRMFGKFDEFYIHYIIVKETLDEYRPILLSSKKELDEELLTQDTIPLKETGSFDLNVLKKIRQVMLWKTGKRKKKP